MINPKYESIINRSQIDLDNNCPFPNGAIVSLAKIFKGEPNGERLSTSSRLVFEIDDLISQTRWHIGQAILISKIYNLTKETSEDDKQFKSIPYHLLLGLREYYSDPEKMICIDYSERRPGGFTFANWIYHLMIDNSIMRSISVLDRIGYLLCLAADIKYEKYYFRSHKLVKVHQKLKLPETQILFEMTKRKIYDFILKYRDNLSHSKKEWIELSAMNPVESYRESNGQIVIKEKHLWSESDLFALANGTYHFLVEALNHCSSVCEKVYNV